LKPGKLADVIVLKRDPVADITVLQGGRHLAHVIKDGRLIDLGEGDLSFNRASSERPRSAAPLNMISSP